MWAERYLRRVKLRRRFTIAGILLVLPMTCLIVASVIVLQQQEADIHQAIDEGVNVLVPLTTLEYDLQRALTDELDAQTGQSVPDYGGLSVSIDRLLSHLRSSPDNPRLGSARLAVCTTRYPAVGGAGRTGTSRWCIDGSEKCAARAGGCPAGRGTCPRSLGPGR